MSQVDQDPVWTTISELSEDSWNAVRLKYLIVIHTLPNENKECLTKMLFQDIFRTLKTLFTIIQLTWNGYHFERTSLSLLVGFHQRLSSFPVSANPWSGSLRSLKVRAAIVQAISCTQCCHLKFVCFLIVDR